MKSGNSFSFLCFCLARNCQYINYFLKMRAVKGEHAVCVSLCGLVGYGAGYSFFNASAGLVRTMRKAWIRIAATTIVRTTANAPM